MRRLPERLDKPGQRTSSEKAVGVAGLAVAADLKSIGAIDAESTAPAAGTARTAGELRLSQRDAKARTAPGPTAGEAGHSQFRKRNYSSIDCKDAQADYETPMAESAGKRGQGSTEDLQNHRGEKKKQENDGKNYLVPQMCPQCGKTLCSKQSLDNHLKVSVRPNYWPL